MSASECIFCEIVNRRIPSERVYEDETVIAFADIAPQAPIHYLVIPKVHVENLMSCGPEHQHLLGHLMLTLPKLAHLLHVKGFRTRIATGKEGGQEVGHLHLHFLAQRTEEHGI